MIKDSIGNLHKKSIWCDPNVTQYVSDINFWIRVTCIIIQNSYLILFILKRLICLIGCMQNMLTPNINIWKDFRFFKNSEIAKNCKFTTLLSARLKLFLNFCLNLIQKFWIWTKFRIFDERLTFRNLNVLNCVEFSYLRKKEIMLFCCLQKHFLWRNRNEKILFYNR